MNKSNENEIILNSLIGKPLEQANFLACSSGFTIRVTREDSTK